FGTEIGFQASRHGPISKAELRMREVFLLLVTLVSGSSVMTAVAAEPVRSPEETPKTVVRRDPSGRWMTQETANFRIRTRVELTSAGRLAETCEALRRQLKEAWFATAGEDWSAKCEIVVHPTTTEYVRALGPGSERTSGCATIEI